MAKMEPYYVLSLSLKHKATVHSAHKVKLLRIILGLSLAFAPLLFLSSIALPTQVVLKPKLLFGRAASPRGWCKTVYFSPLPLSSCYMALEGVVQSQKTTVSDQKTKK